MSQDSTLLRGFHLLAKPIGPICNLNCRYCFYLEKESLYRHRGGVAEWIMPENVLEEYIHQYTESQPASTISFAWQGGEPSLLGVDFFRKVIALQQKYANGKQIENTFQTNGILLDDQWCDFLARNRFLVGLSIDGPEHLHDRYRVDKGGAPTFDKVAQTIGRLKKHGVEFNTLTVVPRYNARYPLDIYHFLKESGSGFMQFIPIVERVAEDPSSNNPRLVAPHHSGQASVSSWSVPPLQYGEFLCSIFDEWVRNDVGKIFVQLFDVSLAAWLGMEPGLCVFQNTCGSAAVIEHSGDIYSCDHYVYPEYRLGNILDQSLQSMLASPQQIRFGRDKLDGLPRQCRECEVRFVCNGECPKHRFVPTADKEEGLNYLCAGYKLFFRHIDPYMKFMANALLQEQPPSNIMAWLHTKDAGVDIRKKEGRNAPCPCGSGLKYKRCCGQHRNPNTTQG